MGKSKKKDSKQDDKDKQQKRSYHSKICRNFSMRLKTYLITIVSCFVFNAIVDTVLTNPVTIYGKYEDKLSDQHIVAVVQQIDAWFNSQMTSLRTAFKKVDPDDFANMLTNPTEEKSKQFISKYFYKQGMFDAVQFGNGLFFFDGDKTFVYGEFYELDFQMMSVNASNPAPVPEILKGTTSESKEYLNVVVNDGFRNVVDIGETEMMGKENIFYLMLTVELKNRNGEKVGYIVSVVDERPIRIGYTMVSDICISEYRPSSRFSDTPGYVKKVEKSLTPFSIGSYDSVEAAGGNFKTVNQKLAGGGVAKESVCQIKRNLTGTDTFLGTTYIAIKDVTKGDKNETLLIMRMDRDLDIVNKIFKVFQALLMSLMIISLMAVIGVLIVFEVLVMRNLHKTKESVERIVMERKAILQEYFSKDSYVTEYYKFKEHHGRSLEDELDMAVLDTGGGSDDLAVLGAIAGKYQEWMEEILMDKIGRLEIMQRENDLLEDSLDMLNTWSGRPDTEFAPSFSAMAEANKETSSDDDEKDDATSSKKDDGNDINLPLVSLAQILHNPIALEFFKTFCINNRIQNSLFFVLDVAWLGLLEETENTRRTAAKSVLTSLVSSTRYQVYRMFTSIYEEYFVHTPKHSDPLKLQPRYQKKIMGAVNKNGKLPYKQSFFKQAAADVRHTLENEYLPMFYAAPLYKAMLLNLRFTSQINEERPVTDETLLYNMPHIPTRDRSATDVGERENKRRKNGMWGTVKLAVFGHEEIADRIVEEKKLKQSRARAGSSATNSPSVRLMTPLQKLRSPANRTRDSSHGSVPSSPLASLLPAAKPRPHGSTPRSNLRDSVTLVPTSDGPKMSIFASHKQETNASPSKLKEDVSDPKSEISEDKDEE